jgi:hypothetical protein
LNTYRHAHFLDFLREIGGPGHHDDNTGREYQSLWLELGQLGSFPYCIISMKISGKHVRNIDKLLITNYWYICKVNSVEEACGKCFAVHILKFEILQITWKKWNKEHQTLSFQFFIDKSSTFMGFVLFFHVVWKISNFDMWTLNPKGFGASFLYWVDFNMQNIFPTELLKSKIFLHM